MTSTATALAVEDDELLHIVRHLVGQQSEQAGKADPAVESWSVACNKLSGDLVLTARTPSKVLHVLLVDAGHHGIGAYLSLLPIISPFQRMTEKGFSAGTIARELNRKVRQTLPANRYIKAQLAAIDIREGIVSVWNGGMPTGLMVDGFGQHFKQFNLMHAPLGQLDDDSFDDLVELHAFLRGEQLVLVSDGLLDAHHPGVGRFGERGVADTLFGLPRSRRRDELVAALNTHLAGHAPPDDMTLVLVDCEQEGLATQSAGGAAKRQEREPGNWSFSLRLDAHELGHLDVVPLLLGVTAQFPLTEGRSGDLFVILSELYNNALDHGILGLDSKLKALPDGMEIWLQQREERLAALEEGLIEIHVAQELADGATWLRIQCRDSGPGFDLGEMLARGRERMSDLSPGLMPFGRGLAMVERISQGIELSCAGSEILVKWRLDPAHIEGGEI
jgi:hypothetical protein